MKGWHFGRAALVMGAVGVTGCSAGDVMGPNESADAVVTPSWELVEGQFKLYADPDPAPQANCDVHTSLALLNAPRPTALLVDRVDGPCQVTVPARTRTYELRLVSAACGSSTYAGQDASGADAITVVDHRERTCEDLVPAQIVVTERSADGGRWERKFSDDPAPGPRAPIVTGSFRLHPRDHERPGDGCDRHTALELSNTPEPVAVLVERATGACESDLPSDLRRYELHLEYGSACGSQVYRGTSGRRVVRITDHRFRLCDDKVPARIIVEERSQLDAAASTLFSSDDARR